MLAPAVIHRYAAKLRAPMPSGRGSTHALVRSDPLWHGERTRPARWDGHISSVVVMWRQLRAAWRFLMDLDFEPELYPEAERIMAESEADAETQVRTVETVAPNDVDRRCDRCGATPFVIWERDAEELRFCLHHSRELATSLYGKGYRSQRLASSGSVAVHNLR